tara:strand:- start:465 stop:656 length:192 start_codon:yes stop_codon:yes gene_type:complete
VVVLVALVEEVLVVVPRLQGVIEELWVILALVLVAVVVDLRAVIMEDLVFLLLHIPLDKYPKD